MTGNIVARRYSRALFAIGAKSGLEELTAYGDDLAALAEALEGAPELLRLFRNPLFSVEEKRKVMDSLLEKMQPSQMVRNFCALLADKGRLDHLPEISAYYGILLDAEKGVVRGELVTAIDLAEAKQDALKEKLEAQTGRKLSLTFSTDPAILGGVKLKVGDRVLDASLRAQLVGLKDNIKRGE